MQTNPCGVECQGMQAIFPHGYLVPLLNCSVIQKLICVIYMCVCVQLNWNVGLDYRVWKLSVNTKTLPPDICFRIDKLL